MSPAVSFGTDVALEGGTKTVLWITTVFTLGSASSVLVTGALGNGEFVRLLRKSVRDVCLLVVDGVDSTGIELGDEEDLVIVAFEYCRLT